MKRLRKGLKKCFIPHAENDHKPHLLRPRTVGFVLILAVAVESVFLFGTAYLAPNSHLFGIIFTNTLVDGTNENRTANNLPTLKISPLLEAAAQDKANDMAENNYFAHTSPAGLSPWYWFEKVGYGFTYAGENLAVNFSDSQDVTNAWMNSPEHRANILNGNFTDIGMATATGTFEGHPAVYVVELFGTPAPAAPPSELPLALVNKAAAAGIPSAAPASAPAARPSAKKIIIASSGLATATSNQSFAAVKGVETQTVSTSAPAGQEGPIAVAQAAAHIPQSNPIQTAAANPRRIADYIYLALIALFALALGVNIFVKIRIQHPQVIFGGMLVILVAGLFIVLNQHALAGAAIL